MFTRGIRGLILAHFLLTLGGLLIHLKIHPVAREAENWIPVIVGIVNLICLPLLFNFKETVGWAYLLNLLTVVVGVATMTHYSIEHWHGAVTIKAVLFQSTLADNLILMAKLPLAHSILRFHRPK